MTRKRKKRLFVKFVLPMNGDVVGDMVHNLNHHSVAFSCHHARPREAPIDAKNALRAAQTRHILLHNLLSPPQTIKQKHITAKNTDTLYCSFVSEYVSLH